MSSIWETTIFIKKYQCPVGESEFLKYECDFTIGAGDIAGALQIFQCSENEISQGGCFLCYELDT